MSALRGMRRFPGLALTARAAASLFAAPARGVRRSVDPWRPLSLRWRRRRARREPIRLGSGAITSRAIWLPQFHLHFSALAGAAWHRTAPAGSMRVTHVHDAKPAVINHRWLARRRPALSMQSSGADRLARFGATTVSFPRTGPAPSQLRARRAWAPLGVTNGASAAGRERQPLLERIAATVSRIGRDPYRLRFQWRRLHPRSTPAEPPIQPAARRRTPAPPLGEGAAYSPRAYRAAEMSWRSERTQPAIRISEGPHRGSSPTGSDHSHITDTSPADVTRPRAEQVATPSHTPLTPALMERLTDDVIRRVERRVRIERERRGL